MFNWEYDIALHEMQGNQASSRSEGYLSWDFSSCGRTVGYILELQRGWPFETTLVQRSQDSCLVTTDTSGISTRLERIIQTLLEVRWETTRPFLVSERSWDFYQYSRRVSPRHL